MYPQPCVYFYVKNKKKQSLRLVVNYNCVFNTIFEQNKK
jgi:hypothetical protein